MDPYIGEIRLFAGNYAPLGWAFCNGQLLSIQQYTALFSIFQNTYGGDGRTTFALPDLRDRVPIHQGQGPGLTDRRLGEMAGDTQVQLIVAEMPAHTHLAACQATATTNDPKNAVWANVSGGRTPPKVYAASPNVAMDARLLQPTGGSEPHNNMQPYTGINFIIALEGIFPTHD